MVKDKFIITLCYASTVNIWGNYIPKWRSFILLPWSMISIAGTLCMPTTEDALLGSSADPSCSLHCTIPMLYIPFAAQQLACLWRVFFLFLHYVLPICWRQLGASKTVCKVKIPLWISSTSTSTSISTPLLSTLKMLLRAISIEEPHYIIHFNTITGFYLVRKAIKALLSVLNICKLLNLFWSTSPKNIEMRPFNNCCYIISPYHLTFTSLGV